MAELLGSVQAGLIQYDSRTRSPREIALVGIEPPFQESYSPVAMRADLDPAWASITRRAVSGTAILDRFAADPEFSRTELYQAWLRPQGIHEAIEMSAIVPPCTVVLASIARPANAAELDSDAVNAMRALHPHLARALQVAYGLQGIDRERQQWLGAFEGIEHAVLVVDTQSRVQRANRAAEALLRRGDGLATNAGVLRCARSGESIALRRLVGAAATNRLVGQGRLAVQRPNGRQPLSVLVSPLGSAVPERNGASASAIVIVTDPERPWPAGAAELSRRHSLTPAEARAVLALVDGGGLSTVADRLGVRLSTVRTLIQRAYAKTGTHRQSELVRLIMAPAIHSGVEA